ncbi:MAG: succinate--hydroxymethylglutarate CoA-transferase [Gammaproteobacteria bacterium]|jgi:succinate--hydroxymethylglutarate CoA-transferase
MLPLENVRVLAVEQYGAGPFGTSFLADQGAEVIKIENPLDGGDTARDVGPYFVGERDSLFFHAFNRNKKSITLDLSRPEGKALFHRLVVGADGVTSNLRGDVPDKLGLTHDALSEHNPRIVCAHLSAYGRTGPRANWPGYDYLMQAEAGYFSLTGEPGGPPARFGLSVVDLMTGLAMSYALLAGLTQARATGTGRDMDVSLFDIALNNTNYLASWYLNAGHVQGREPRSAHPALVPCQMYKTSDGWIFLMCNKEKFWPALCNAIDHPEWSEDVRFADFKQRLSFRDLLTEMLDEALSTRTTAQWMEIFGGSVPASPINDIESALNNPFVTEQGRIQEIPRADGSTLRLIAPPIVCSDPPPARPGPDLGEHTDEVLRSAGIADAEIEALRRDQVI